MKRIITKSLEWVVEKYLSWDSNDPVGRVKRRYAVLACSWSVMLLALLMFFLVFGVPHLQVGKYRYNGQRETNGWVKARNKFSANYLSITGWKNIESYEYGQEGCPVMLFVPVSECLFSKEPGPYSPH